ncbi:MAG: trypsin-like peptidase domain-containing protein [Erysipelotrichaceae bacterium]|nr:trypsin-like peptidase domain-containing protein [Erysipelotrichaceae bacterium]
MTENNNFEKVEPIEITSGNIENNKPVEDIKPKSNLPKYLLICGLSITSGFLGGYFSSSIFPQKVIYEQKNIVEHTATNSDNMSIQQVVANVQDSVVEINVSSSRSGFLNQPISSQSAGSGVIFTSDGYIVTNNHVIEGADEIRVKLKDGQSYNARIIGSDVKSDLAVLKIDAENLMAATFGDSNSILVGDTAIVIGNPLGELGGSVTSGIISALDREINVENQPMNLLQTNAEINPGNSGGGLFNSAGELVGIVNAKTSATSIEGIGFAIPINDAKVIIEELVKNGYVSNRATLGIYTKELSLDTSEYKAGLYVKEVIDNSGAQKAGMKAYDRIVSVDGIEISTYTDLSKILKKLSPNDTIEVVVERNSELITLNVTLTQAIRQ